MKNGIDIKVACQIWRPTAIESDAAILGDSGVLDYPEGLFGGIKQNLHGGR